jgi:hypothetical protein
MLTKDILTTLYWASPVGATGDLYSQGLLDYVFYEGVYSSAKSADYQYIVASSDIEDKVADIRARHDTAVTKDQAWIDMATILRRCEAIQEELDTWQSVFPDIAPASVQPDRSLLETKLEDLIEAIKPFKALAKNKVLEFSGASNEELWWAVNHPYSEITIGDFRRLLEVLNVHDIQ